MYWPGYWDQNDLYDLIYSPLTKFKKETITEQVRLWVGGVWDSENNTWSPGKNIQGLYCQKFQSLRTWVRWLWSDFVISGKHLVYFREISGLFQWNIWVVSGKYLAHSRTSGKCCWCSWSQFQGTAKGFKKKKDKSSGFHPDIWYPDIKIKLSFTLWPTTVTHCKKHGITGFGYPP